MEDVELLVECFYGYEAILKAKEAEIDQEELELIAEMGEEMIADEPDALKMSKAGTKITEKAKPGSSPNVDEV
jgi:hypothetical protein